jgi:hypothetical protein
MVDGGGDDGGFSVGRQHLFFFVCSTSYMFFSVIWPFHLLPAFHPRSSPPLSPPPLPSPPPFAGSEHANPRHCMAQ